jgi:hypothetical protein
MTAVSVPPEGEPSGLPQPSEVEIRAFTRSFEPHVGALVRDMAQRAAERRQSGGESMATALYDSGPVGVATALSAIRVPGDLPAGLLPSSLRTVRQSAHHGEPVELVWHTYTDAHAIFQEHLFAHAARQGTDLATLREIIRRLFEYYDWTLPAVTEAYERELAARLSDDQQRRRRLVERLLAGDGTVDLGYKLDRLHVAIVLDPGCAAELPAMLAADVGVEILASGLPGEVTWLWVPADEVDPGELADRLARLVGAGHAGISEAQHGLGGFISTHQKAAIALRLGAARDALVTRYRDVALEAVAFGGEAMAVEFTRAELGGLAEDSERGEGLRQTLGAYFAHGGSTTAAAADLGIAERTVTYRLRRAEELLGRPISERRADLETALRLFAVLDLS